MDRNLALEAVRVTEAAALAAARLLGSGDDAAVDQAATAAMHRVFGAIAINGRIVIGEGEKDADRLLCAGDRVGVGSGPEIEVALDALEGSTICALGGPNGLSVIAFGEQGAFLRCPDTHMDKIAVGPAGRGVVHLDRSPSQNIRALAEARGVYVGDLAVVVLDRPRHERLIAEIRRTGARLKLLSDGDLSAAIATSQRDSGVDLLMGSGGAAQGVLAAAALRCLGGEIQGHFKPRSERELAQLVAAGLTELDRTYRTEDMVGSNVMFAATGVTNGDYLRGVRFFRGGATTNSVVMRATTRTVRFIEAIHQFDRAPSY